MVDLVFPCHHFCARGGSFLSFPFPIRSKRGCHPERRRREGSAFSGPSPGARLASLSAAGAKDLLLAARYDHLQAEESGSFAPRACGALRRMTTALAPLGERNEGN